MASKKGVVMYYDILEQLEDFTDEQFGKITRAIIKYDKTGEVPEFDDPSLKVVFKFMKPTLDRNKQEYEAICEKRRLSGSLGGKQKVANASKCYQNLANLADNDNDNDKENDNDIKKEIILKKENEESLLSNGVVTEQKRSSISNSNSNIFKKPSKEEVEEYCRERNNNVNAEQFIDFYESKGWYIGKNKMKDWKASVRLWEKRDNQKQTQKPKLVRKEATDEEKEDYLRVIREREEMFKI